MFERLKTMLAKWDSIKEVNALSERDLLDLNLTRAQLIDFVQIPKDSPDRLAAMAGLLGMAREDLMADYPTYVERLHSCGHCDDRKSCAHVLAAGQPVSAADVPFCPNAKGIAAELA